MNGGLINEVEGRRRKKGVLLLGLAFLFAAVVLTILFLPGPNAPRSPFGAPPYGPASTTPSSTPTPTPFSAQPARAGGGVPVSCEVGSDGSTIFCPKDFAISGGANGLYPGRTLELALTLTNPNTRSIRVTSITVTATGTPDCPGSHLNTTDYEGSPELIVPGNGTATIALPISMSHDAPDACQGVTFALAYTGEAGQA